MTGVEKSSPFCCENVIGGKEAVFHLMTLGVTRSRGQRLQTRRAKNRIGWRSNFRFTTSTLI